MEIKLNPAQREAVELRDTNILVSAGAGSGKTKVLVERILRRVIDERIDIDRLLVVTFTNMAATEMKERISKALLDRLDNANVEESEHIRRQLGLLNVSSISTLHSFCLKILRDNRSMLTIDPNFKIVSQEQGEILKSEALEEVLEKFYDMEDSRFQRLVDSLSGDKDDIGFEKALLNVYEFCSSFENPEQKLKEFISALKFDSLKDSICYPVLVDEIRVELSYYKESYDEIIEDLIYAENEGYLATFKGERDKIESLMSSLDIGYKAFQDEMRGFEFDKLSRIKAKDDKELADRAKKLRESFKKRFAKLVEINTFKSEDEMLKDFEIIRDMFEVFLDVYKSFGNAYSKRKRDKNYIDFSDIEHMTINLLMQNKSLSEYLKDKYVEIMIDEYQDTSNVQESIIRYIAKPDNLFMVGDVKQSIYRFRQASPELFLQKYKSYKRESSNEKSLGRTISLNTNYRSRQGIIAFINDIFTKIMTESLGELDYSAGEALMAGASFGEEEGHLYPEEINLTILHKDEDSDDEVGYMEAEAEHIAVQIRSLIDSGKLVEGRPISYKDIVILLRSTVGWKEALDRACNKYEIPFYSETSGGYFSNLEVIVAMSLLSVIDNPHDDVALLSVMRSIVGGFDEGEMVKIRSYQTEGNRNKSFYDLVTNFCRDEAGDREIIIKLKSLIDRLESYRDFARYMDLDSLIWYIYDDSKLYSYMGGLRGGALRQANLKLLAEKAKAFSDSGWKSVFNFLRFVDRLKAQDKDLEKAKLMTDQEDAVRMLSVHKSKGLEFPVVFLAGLGRGFNLRSVNDNLAVHGVYGFGPVFVDVERRVKYKTLAYDAIERVYRIESLSEELRILYVALTRAREKLYLSGHVGKIDSRLDKWEGYVRKDKSIDRFSMQRSSNYLDWICPAILANSGMLRGRIERGSYSLNIDYKSIKLSDEPIQEGYVEEKIDAKIEDLDLGIKYLVYEYPYIASTKIPTKMSVGEYKRLLEERDDYSIKRVDRVPRFMEGGKVSGARLGSIYHLILQSLELKEYQDIDSLDEGLRRLVQIGILKVSWLSVIDKAKIMGYLRSDIYKDVLKASKEGKVYREIPFNHSVRVSEIYEGFEDSAYEDERVLVQGIIDLFFELEDKLYLIDFKSDRFVSETDLVDRYKGQLKIYKAAVESITDRKLDKVIIYSLFKLLPIELKDI